MIGQAAVLHVLARRGGVLHLDDRFADVLQLAQRVLEYVVVLGGQGGTVWRHIYGGYHVVVIDGVAGRIRCWWRSNGGARWTRNGCVYYGYAIVLAFDGGASVGRATINQRFRGLAAVGVQKIGDHIIVAVLARVVHNRVY